MSLFFRLKALAFVICLTSPAISSPLDDAKILAETTFKDFGYQLNGKAENKKTDCTQFVAAVLAKSLGRKLTVSEESGILIKGITKKEINGAIEKKDLRLKGVVAVITSLKPAGSEIAPENAKSGDFVQYWIKGNDGNWWGHSAILGKVWKGGSGAMRATIYGAHASGVEKEDPGFIGEKLTKSGLNLSDPNRLIYIARVPK